MYIQIDSFIHEQRLLQDRNKFNKQKDSTYHE